MNHAGCAGRDRKKYFDAALDRLVGARSPDHAVGGGGSGPLCAHGADPHPGAAGAAGASRQAAVTHRPPGADRHLGNRAKPTDTTGRR